MNIGITGATGFIGSHVAAKVREAGHEVVAFSRNARGPGQRAFSLDTPPDVRGLDAMIHLAGEPIFGLWTKEKMRRIRESRVQGTRRVVEAIAAAPQKPAMLVCASGVGFYGDTGEQPVDEGAPIGKGFLAEVCRDWEAEAHRAEAFGVRVVCVRNGFVLGQGGALKIMTPIFRLGLGGKLGNGRQWMSCVHVEDVAGIMLWAVENAAVSGAVNAVMPETVRNAEFTRDLAHAVRRPAFFAVPAFALRLALGELSRAMLDSVRVRPEKAIAGGYHFKFAAWPGALQAALE